MTSSPRNLAVASASDADADAELEIVESARDPQPLEDDGLMDRLTFKVMTSCLSVEATIEKIDKVQANWTATS